MKNYLYLLVIGMLVAYADPALGAGEIKVLLMKQPGLSSSLTISILQQMNNTLDNSNLFPTHFVSSAHESLGSPVVHLTSCTDTNPGAAADCLANESASLREQYAADLVIAVLDNLDQCGSTRPGTVNRPLIGPANYNYAFAVVRDDCLEFPENGMRIASHEIGHILNLEHSADPPATSKIPVQNNHAAELNCINGNEPDLRFSFFPSQSGGAVDDFIIERAYGSGSWGSPILNPTAGCAGFPGIVNILNKFRITASGPGGSAECIAVILPNCEEPPPT